MAPCSVHAATGDVLALFLLEIGCFCVDPLRTALTAGDLFLKGAGL
jgi:hypothetical protein